MRGVFRAVLRSQTVKQGRAIGLVGPRIVRSKMLRASGPSIVAFEVLKEMIVP